MKNEKEKGGDTGKEEKQIKHDTVIELASLTQVREDMFGALGWLSG